MILVCNAVDFCCDNGDAAEGAGERAGDVSKLRILARSGIMVLAMTSSGCTAGEWGQLKAGVATVDPRRLVTDMTFKQGWLLIPQTSQDRFLDRLEEMNHTGGQLELIEVDMTLAAGQRWTGVGGERESSGHVRYSTER